MKMITKEIEKKLPRIGETGDKKPEEVRVYLKFFNPCGGQTWYITEFDGEDAMFGYVTGMGCDELGYISFAELKGVRVAMGLRIERDLYWDDKKTLADVMKKDL